MSDALKTLRKIDKAKGEEFTKALAYHYCYSRIDEKLWMFPQILILWIISTSLIALYTKSLTMTLLLYSF